MAINYDDLVRGRGGAAPTSRPYSGVELGIPIERLYPDGLPTGARLAIALVLTSADGRV